MPESQPFANRIGRVLIATGLGLALVCGLLALARAARPALAAPSPPRLVTTSSALQTTIGTTDSIQLAIDNASPGDTVVVTNTRVYTEPITIWKPITLTGASATSTIVYSTGNSIIRVITDNVIITDLTLNGGATKPAASGVRIEDSADVTVSGLTINRLDFGVQVRGSYTSVTGITLTNNIIVNNVITPSDAGINGIYFFQGTGAPGAIQATVQYNQIAGFGSSGDDAPIKAYGLAPSLIADNVLTLTTANVAGGIDVNQAGPSLIRGNVFDTPIAPPVAILVEGTANPTITQNIIDPGFLTGILVGNTAQPLITASLLSSLNTGVSVRDTAAPTIRNCSIINNGGDGISLGIGTAVRLEGNLIQNNGSDGVSLGDLAILLQMEGNTICSNSGFGLRNDSNLTQLAASNWWGHNPPLDGDALPPSDYTNVVTTTPEISLAVSAQPVLIPLNGTAAVTAAMHDGLISYTVRDGTPINFTADAGVFDPAAANTLNGLATTTYTGTTLGTHVISATDGCGGSVTTTVTVGQAVLTATKAADPPHGSPVVPGQLIVYTVTVTNTGGYTATGLVFSDTVPIFTQLAFASVETGTISTTNPISATFAPIAPDGVMTVTIGVTVTTPLTNGTLIANTAAISYFNGATNAVTTTNQVTHVVSSSPQLTITKTATPPHGSVVRPGDLITYTLRISNSGDAHATGVVISDAIPGYTTAVFNDATAGVVITSSDPLLAGISLLPAPTGTAVITLAVQVTSPLTNGTLIANTAQVTATEFLTVTTSNLVTHLVESAPQLAVTKTADPPHGSPVVPGQLITYTLRVTNTGDEVATGVVVTDRVPVYTDYAFSNTVAGTIAQAGGVITWTIGTLTVDGPVTATVGVTVTTPLTNGTLISNAGWLTYTGASVITSSNTVTHQVQSGPVVTYTKEAVPPHGSVIALSLSPPTQITYTIWVTNDGNANATGLTITDTVPANTSGSSLLWSPDFLAGEGGVISNTFAVTVNVPLDDLTIITNSYEVSYDQAGTVFTPTSPLSPTNVVTHLIRSAPDITVTKAAIPSHGSTVTPGDVISYSFTFTNNGTANATGIVLSDTIPANTTFITNSARASTGAVVTSTMSMVQVATPTLSAPGGVLTFTFAVRVNAPLTNGTLIADSGWYSFDQSAGITQTNLVTHLVQSAPDITLTKTAIPPHGSVITPGDRITYTITITNNGTADATGAELTDTVPQYTSYVPGTASPIPTAFDPLVWNFGIINGLGGVATATFAVQVDVPLTNGIVISNTAWLDISETVGLSGTNVVTHLVQSAVAITFTKSANPPSGSTVAPGDPITYTLVAANAGTELATGVVMTDTLPPEVNVITYTATKAPPPTLSPPRTMVWNLGTLTADEAVTATIQVTVTTPLTRGTLITDVARLQTDQAGISTTNTVTHTVLSTPTLTLSKSAEPPQGSVVRLGDPITYTLDVTNSGNGPATGFLITDTVPATTTFVSWLGVTPGFTTGGPNPLAISGTLGAGQAMTATFAVTVSLTANEGDVISNTGYVSYAESAVISPTNSVTHLVQVTPAITLSKVADPSSGSTVRPGDRITYTVWVSNAGATDGTNVVISDTVPAHTNYVSGSLSSTLGSITEANPLVVDVGTLTNSATMSFTFQVTVTTPLTDSTIITNAAQLGADYLGITESNWVTHTVVATPLLSVVKTNSPSGQVSPGDALLYTLNVRNDGDGNATNVVITDVLPGEVHYLGALVSDPNATSALIDSTWALTIPLLPGGGTQVDATIVLTVTTPLTNGLVFTNVASYLSDQTPVTDSNVVTNVVDSEPVLVIAKSSDPPDGSVVNPGDTITYTVTVANTGTEHAPNLVITDTLPAYTNYTTGSASIVGGVNSTATYMVPNTVVGAADWLNVGDVVTLTYAVTVTTPLTDGTIIPNIALVGSDRTAVDNTNMVTHVVQSQVALTYTKTAQPPPGPIAPGEPITYTITLSNSGSADATGLVLTDTVPTYANFVLGSESASGMALESGGVLTFTGDVPGMGGVFTATFAVTVTTPLTNGTPIVNVASFITTQTGVVSQTNSVTHTVVSTPSLTISKSANPPSGSSVEPGDWITYTLTAVNNGTADATGVIITDTLDPNVNFVDVTPTTGISSLDPLVFNVGALPGNGGVVSYTVRVTVTTPLTNGTLISNAAQATATEVLTVTLSNYVTHPVVATPLLSVVKTNVPVNQVSPGDPLIYTLRIRNDGDGNAMGVVITDVLPSVVNFWFDVVPPPATRTISGTTWMLSIPSLPGGGAEVNVPIVLTVTTPLTNGLVFTNVASYLSDQTLVTDSNVVTNVVDSEPVLVIAKSSDPPDGSVVSPGDMITYTITVANIGTENAPNVVITDTLPAYTNYVTGSVSMAGGINSTATYTLSNTIVGAADWLNVGDTISLSYAVTVTVPLTDGTIIPNIALVDSNRTAVDNTNMVTHVVQSQVVLTYTKTAEPPAGPITPGETITYTIALTNDGTADATGLVLTDTVPVYVNFVPGSESASGTALVSGGVLTFTGGVPGMGGVFSATFAVTVSIPLTDGTQIVNVAGFSSTQTGVVSQTNRVTHTVSSAPALVLTKSAVPASGSVVEPGEWITYTLTASNSGTADATRVVITDTLDANLNFVDVTPGAGVSGPNPLIFDVGMLPGNGGVISYTVRVTVTTPLTSGTLITNAARMAATEVPTVTQSNEVTHTVVATPNLTILKWAAPPHGSTVDPGDSISYLIYVGNSGNGPATNLTITDSLPISTSYIGTWFTPLTTTGTISGPDPLVATISVLPSGGWVTFGFAVSVTTSAPPGLVIPNVAQVDSNETVVTSTNVVTHVVRTPELVVAKRAIPAGGTVGLLPGSAITYTVTVTNVGGATAHNVVISDTLDLNVTLVTSATTPAVPIFGPNPVTATWPSLAPGATASLVMQVVISSPLANGTVISNLASGDSDETMLVVTGPVTHGVGSFPILSLSKSADPPDGTSVSPGDTITYSLAVTNGGFDTANGLVLTDTLPGGVSYVPGSASVTPGFGIAATAPPALVITGTLPAGNALTATFRVTVSTVTSGTLLVNTAEVTATDTSLITDATTHTVIVPAPSPVVTKTATPVSGSVVEPGDLITYTVTVQNSGSGLATGVVLSDTLDTDVALVSAVASIGTVHTGPPLSVDGFDLAAGNTMTVTMVVTVTDVPSGTLIANQASVTSTQTLSPQFSGVVTHVVSSTVSVPNLVITKTATPASGSVVEPGDWITYTVTVVNSGGPASGVVISDTLDLANVTLGTSSTTTGTLSSPNPVQVTGFNLNSGQAVTVTLGVTVTGNVSGTLITNQASVTSTQTPSPQFSGVVTHVISSTLPAPSLVITKTATPVSGSIVEPGDWITYTVTVVNSGGPASNVVISDTLDLANVTLVTSSTTTGTLSGPNPVRVTGFNLDSGQAVTVTLGVTVTGNVSGTLITNQASVTSTQTPLPQFSAVVTHVISSTGVVSPSFTMIKSADPPDGTPVTQGDTITYTIAVVNTGGPATGVVLTDAIPAGTTYVPGSVTTNLGAASSDGTLVTVTVPSTFPNSFILVATFRVTVSTNLSTTIANTAVLDSNETAPQNSNAVVHPVQGTATPPSVIYLPIIFRNFSGPSASLAWVGKTADRVRLQDGAAGLVPDGLADGAFSLTVNVGSMGPKTVSSVRLISSQGPGIEWDTIANTLPVLGVFDGSARINEPDGTISQDINGQVIVTLYASDDGSRFPADEYDYNVTVNFIGGTSVSASARIPPPLPSLPPPPPPPPTPGCAPELLGTITVGDTPRGIAIDSTRKRVYVANYGSSSLSVIDSNTNALIQTVTGIASANGVAYDPTHNLIWVTNYSSDQVTPIQANASATSFTPLAPVAVGDGPWGVAYDPIHDYIYVVNRLGNSVTVVDADPITPTVVATLVGSFNQPFHGAANPVTGKVYVTNFGNHSVTVVDGTSVSGVVNLNVGDDPSTQPYGVAVDEIRNLVYVATVNSHRVVVIGTLVGVPDQFLGWSTFHRGFGDPARPVPMRAIAVNPSIGPAGDGGHVWTTTSTGDGSERNQALLIPKGWGGYFHFPVPHDAGTNPSEGIAVDRTTNRVYVSSATTPGTLTVLGDSANTCVIPFGSEEGIGFELFTLQ